MDIERKRHVLEFDDFSSVTIREAIEWIEDINSNVGILTDRIGCTGISCVKCKLLPTVRKPLNYSDGMCYLIIKQILNCKLKDTGYGKGVKFGL
jgi:hypothetical protein